MYVCFFCAISDILNISLYCNRNLDRMDQPSPRSNRHLNMHERQPQYWDSLAADQSQPSTDNVVAAACQNLNYKRSRWIALVVARLRAGRERAGGLANIGVGWGGLAVPTFARATRSPRSGSSEKTARRNSYIYYIFFTQRANEKCSIHWHACIRTAVCILTAKSAASSFVQ